MPNENHNQKVGSFEDFAELIRKFEGRNGNVPILRSTRIERDLGIVGDDGFDLLRRLEGHFGFRFGADGRPARQVFKLAQKELLFSPEGFDVVGFILWLMGCPREVKELTVGDLFDVVSAELQQTRA